MDRGVVEVEYCYFIRVLSQHKPDPSLYYLLFPLADRPTLLPIHAQKASIRDAPVIMPNM